MSTTANDLRADAAIAVTVQYFAAFRERAGCADEIANTKAKTAAELFDEVAARHGFADAKERCKLAVNGKLASWDSPIADGDQVLFFPPVAGG
ncbi:MAG: MoaD/ThiS family protein [Gammaproteobacteria bacterium]|nr:MoaD/ThiS family protein [Gammaproteobacteria bacterium]